MLAVVVVVCVKDGNCYHDHSNIRPHFAATNSLSVIVVVE
jgi:hypothetical protein